MIVVSMQYELMARFGVGNFSEGITSFDPANDELDFGFSSVHRLSLGQEPNEMAKIVYPWQRNRFQQILGVDGQGMRCSDFDESNSEPLGYEHLPGDTGCDFSWGRGISPAVDVGSPGRNCAVCIRSHECDGVKIIEVFDLLAEKINFMCFRSREHLSVGNQVSTLLISSGLIGQHLVFKGIRKEQLVGANLDFQFDQMLEDLHGRVFAFSPQPLSLVDHTKLFTSEGSPTDCSQAPVGTVVTASGEAPGQPGTLKECTHPIQELGSGMGMDTTSRDLANVVMNLSGGSNVHNSCLQLDVDGSLWWDGGMGGNLIVRNPMGFAIDDWEVSFLTPHDRFQSWAGGVTVEDAGNGLNRVTFTPATWNDIIPANCEISISFNAQGVGLFRSGLLKRSQFFAPAQSLVKLASMSADAMTHYLMPLSNFRRGDHQELVNGEDAYDTSNDGVLMGLFLHSGQVLSENMSLRRNVLNVKQTGSVGFNVCVPFWRR